MTKECSHLRKAETEALAAATAVFSRPKSRRAIRSLKHYRGLEHQSSALRLSRHRRSARIELGRYRTLQRARETHSIPRHHTHTHLISRRTIILRVPEIPQRARERKTNGPVTSAILYVLKTRLIACYMWMYERMENPMYGSERTRGPSFSAWRCYVCRRLLERFSTCGALAFGHFRR